MLPKYKYLLSYRCSEIIYDLTVGFCEKFLSGFDYRRLREQMIQAARSTKQNIVEGVEGSRTSTKTEIKLLGVAMASLEELLADYEDFLRQKRLDKWEMGNWKVERCRNYVKKLTNVGNLGVLGDLKEKPVLPKNSEVAANLLLTLCHTCSFLLGRQIKVCEDEFIRNGGYTENLFKKRLSSRMGQKFP